MGHLQTVKKRIDPDNVLHLRFAHQIVQEGTPRDYRKTAHHDEQSTLALDTMFQVQ